MSAAEEMPPPLSLYRVEHAKMLQRQGMTFSEIAKRMGVARKSVVDALYWELSDDAR